MTWAAVRFGFGSNSSSWAIWSSDRFCMRKTTSFATLRWASSCIGFDKRTMIRTAVSLGVAPPASYLLPLRLELILTAGCRSRSARRGSAAQIVLYFESVLLKVRLQNDAIQAKLGSMVAYQGDVRFEYQSGGTGRFFKKALTGEGVKLMAATGTGDLFLAQDK